MKGDLHAGHLSASFSSLSPQFPQIGTFMTGLNEDIRLDVFSMTFLTSFAFVPFGIFSCTSIEPLRIVAILLHSVISSLFAVSFVIIPASSVIPSEYSSLLAMLRTESFPYFSPQEK